MVSNELSDKTGDPGFMKRHPLLYQFSCILLLFFLFLGGPVRAEDQDDIQLAGHNKWLAYILGKQLPVMHYSHKPVDNDLAVAVFDLYLKQLDFQKRFLLQSDVEILKAYTLTIDDRLKDGKADLPGVGHRLLNRRIVEIKEMVDKIAVADFDTEVKEYYETDPDKLDFARNLKELQERWRLIVKGQVFSRYLDLQEEQEKAEVKKGASELWQMAKDKVAKRNREIFHRLEQETRQDHYDRFFNAVTRAFDPHTGYLPPAGKEDFDIHMRGSLDGIGALLREEDGYIKVVRIIPGSASARQGRLEAEDIILEVAQGIEEPVDVTDMRLRDAVRLIRGPKGSEVRLGVKKSDGTLDLIPIIRDVVQIEETFVKSTILNGPDGSRIGYLLIPSFYRDFENSGNGQPSRNSTDDTRAALLELKAAGVDGLILDMRNNGGGSLIDAVDIAGLFIREGPIVQIKTSGSDRKILRDEDPQRLYDGPMVALVNQFSASASEIVAAALQDYHRAVIIGGHHTHGKGTVQTVVDLNDLLPFLKFGQGGRDFGALKVTIQKFYRVNGGSTQYRGVEPDIVLPSLFQYLESGEQYLDYSLPWDQLEAVEYKLFDGKSFDVATLAVASKDRTAVDPGLQVIADEATKAQIRSKGTRISLRLADMIQERADARQARTKLGAHYRQYRVEQGNDLDLVKSEDEAKVPDEDKWLEDVREDPYVGEAMRVVADLRR